MTDFIRFENVSYSYDTVYYDESCPGENRGVRNAVNAVSFCIEKGEFTAIVGRNGSGKSTIARMMNALLLPACGDVYVNGINTKEEEKIWDIRRLVGMVFQNPDNQIVGATVEDDIAFGLENLGMPRDDMITRIDEAIATVHLENERGTEPNMLSGGQKQRCAIAGITAMRPDCIVLDEATAMLDPIGRKEVMALFRKLNKEQGITIIHITHHMDEVSEADRVILIDNGGILADMPPAQLFMNRKLVEAAGLEVPRITALIEILNKKLKQKGMQPLPDGIITAEAGISALSELLCKICTQGKGC